MPKTWRDIATELRGRMAIQARQRNPLHQMVSWWPAELEARHVVDNVQYDCWPTIVGDQRIWKVLTPSRPGDPRPNWIACFFGGADRVNDFAALARQASALFSTEPVLSLYQKLLGMHIDMPELNSAEMKTWVWLLYELALWNPQPDHFLRHFAFAEPSFRLNADNLLTQFAPKRGPKKPFETCEIYKLPTRGGHFYHCGVLSHDVFTASMIAIDALLLTGEQQDADSESTGIDVEDSQKRESAKATRPPAEPRRHSKKYEILQALYEQEAFSKRSLRCIREIAEKAGGQYAKPKNYKQAVSELRREGLIATLGGRGGGCWLTSEGQEMCKRLFG